tara:strand:+ start:702 stop:1010 length:309 start_codon:yes stop_codon:yes gene_type:complete
MTHTPNEETGKIKAILKDLNKNQRLIESYMDYEHNSRLDPYHSSLDMLQPVLEKILRSEYFLFASKFDTHNKAFIQAVRYMDTFKLYLFVINFIKMFDVKLK